MVRVTKQSDTWERRPSTVPLHAIDRSAHIGILSSAYLPPVGPGGGVESLLDVIARARNGDVAGESAVVVAGAFPDGGEESASEVRVSMSASDDGDDDDDDDGDGDGDGDGGDHHGHHHGHHHGGGERVVDGADWGGCGFDADDSVWLSVDHADAAAVEGLRDAAAAAAAAAEDDANASVGLPLPGVRLVVWIMLAVINQCFDHC
jgi:hypothetical protein